MTCTLFFINWNDSFYLPFIKRHYSPFCTKIVMYDNHSTDNSVELAKELGFEVRTFGTPGVLSDSDYLQVKNHCWKGCTSDWVIVCDADEFIYDLHIDKSLQTLKSYGRTILETEGWQMYSHTLPKESILEINYGFLDVSYNKPCIFNPQAIDEINFVPGCHRAMPTGNVVWGKQQPKLLHYRNIGGPRRLLERHAEYRNRLSQENINNRWGYQYLFSPEKAQEIWNQSYNLSKPVF